MDVRPEDGVNETGDDDREHAAGSTQDVAEAVEPGPGSDEPEGPKESDDGGDDGFPFGRLGRPFRRSPFMLGLTGAFGVFTAWVIAQAVLNARSVLVLIVVSMFLAVGLNPVAEMLQRRGLSRKLAVALVFAGVVAMFVGFGFAIVPPLTEQTAAFVNAVPDYINQLQNNRTIARLDRRYQLLEKAQEFVSGSSLGQRIFGGIVGVGKTVLNAAFSTITVLVLTLYFLASLPAIKNLAYRLAPRSRRARVSLLGDAILSRVGGYVGGALAIAFLAGTTTFVFLEIVGVPYALPLALLIAIVDLIPFVGITIGATVVALVGLTSSLKVAIACVIFFIAYQQLENYVIYPRIMKHSVDVSATVTIVAVLLGGALLGIVGALLAIPSAAAISLIMNEVVLPRQEQS